MSDSYMMEIEEQADVVTPLLASENRPSNLGLFRGETIALDYAQREKSHESSLGWNDWKDTMMGNSWVSPTDYFEKEPTPLSARIGWAVMAITHFTVYILALEQLIVLNWLREDLLTVVESKILAFAMVVLITDFVLCLVLLVVILTITTFGIADSLKGGLGILSLISDALQTLVYDILALYGLFMLISYLVEILAQFGYHLSLDPLEQLNNIELLAREHQNELSFDTFGFLLSVVVLGLFYMIRSVKTMNGLFKFVWNASSHSSTSSLTDIFFRGRMAHVYVNGEAAYTHSLDRLRNIVNAAASIYPRSKRGEYRIITQDYP